MDEQGLVADAGGVAVSGNVFHPGSVTTVPARDHAWTPAPTPRLLDEPDGQGCLAGTADDHVADHDDRNRQGSRAQPAQPERQATHRHQHEDWQRQR
jgi:hypothetical protein